MVRAKKQPKTDPSYKRLKGDYYPVQRTINVASTGSAQIHLIDTGALLSTVNHRLYRQGKTYRVKVDLDNEVAANTGQYTVWALVDTWWMMKAWQLARATYEESMAEERTSMGDKMAARWEDFRIDDGTNGARCQPYMYTGGAAMTGAPDSDGEFLNSRITLSDGTTQRTFTLGSTTGSVLGIIEEFDKFDNTPIRLKSNDLAYAGVNDELQEASADDLKDRGDNPPYNPTNINAGIWYKVGVLDNTPVNGMNARLSTGFFNAPLGFVVVQAPAPGDDIVGEISLTVQSGDYKGVKAHNLGV